MTTVAQLVPRDQDLIKRALLVYYEQCLDAYKHSPHSDLNDDEPPNELEVTMMEIADMYGTLTGEEIPNR